MSSQQQQQLTDDVQVGDFAMKPVWTPFSVRLRSLLLLRIMVALALAWQIGSTILLAVVHEYNMNMYTFWSYTLLTVFYTVLAVALFWERMLITLTTVFALPLVVGNAVFVALAIIIILANNAEAYRKGSECDTPAGDLSLEELHTGDWLIHGGPVFGLLLVLLAGLEFFGQRLIVRQLRTWTAASQWLYWVYWMVSPLVLIVIYQLCFDVDKLYPTSFTLTERTLILAALTLCTQLLWWLIFTQVPEHEQLHAHSVPTLHDVVVHGHGGNAHFEPSWQSDAIAQLTVGSDENDDAIRDVRL
jgi:hypothetical protein